MKTRKNKTRKGGHKVQYDYQGNIDAGTNKPLTGKYVNENNCLACALYSLGFMSESTARYLQRITPYGVRNQSLLDMINDTYGPGHTLEPYPNEESIKTYLQPGQATLGQYGGTVMGVAEWGHFFIVFRSKNGKLYAIDSQEGAVSLLSTFLSTATFDHFLILTEPSSRPSKRKIIPEVVKKALDKDSELYKSQLLSLYPFPTVERDEKLD